MTEAAESLLEQALTLPAPERARLASGLLASLDDDAIDEGDVDRLWSVETARRAEQLAAGEVEPVTWEHVLRQVDARRNRAT